MIDPTLLELEVYRRDNGKRAELMIKHLSKLVGFAEAYSTDAGKKILDFCLNELNGLYEKMIAGNISGEELAVLNFIKNKYLPHVGSIFSEYVRLSGEIKDGVDGSRKKERD